MNRGYLELLAVQQDIEQFLRDAESLHSGSVSVSKLFSKYRGVQHFNAAVKTIVRVDGGYHMIVEKYSKMLDDLKSNVENISTIIDAIEQVETIIEEEKALLPAVHVAIEQAPLSMPVKKKRNKKKIKN